MPRKLTVENFIERANIIHNNKYDYSEIEYINNSTNIKINCPKHGIFEQRPCNHLNNQGCPKCGVKKRAKTHLYDNNIFIENAKLVHGDKFDYSQVNYVNSKTKIKIGCFTHGIFEQVPSSHLTGIGCPKCCKQYKLTTETFIKKAIDVHGDKYVYDEVEYIKNNIKIKIICKVHGIFEQMPNTHLTGYGCSKCSGNYMDRDYFIERANKIHNDKYDYSNTVYYNNHTKINIICPIHGEFSQRPNTHLNSCGCPKCGMLNTIKGLTLSQEEYISRANIVHSNKYDYKLLNYINARHKIIIICPEHGEFEQRPFDHLNGSGCRKCVESSGERKIRMFLENNNINHEKEKIFDGCKNKICLPFDFYLPEHNTLIEFDGIQHFKPIKFFGGDEGFKNRIESDLIKTNFAVNNGYELIRISYLDNINDILNNLLMPKLAIL